MSINVINVQKCNTEWRLAGEMAGSLTENAAKAVAAAKQWRKLWNLHAMAHSMAMPASKYRINIVAIIIIVKAENEKYLLISSS